MRTFVPGSNSTRHGRYIIRTTRISHPCIVSKPKLWRQGSRVVLQHRATNEPTALFPQRIRIQIFFHTDGHGTHVAGIIGGRDFGVATLDTIGSPSHEFSRVTRATRSPYPAPSYISASSIRKP
ncbi:unnamed protein product [Rhizoctonia solani]|uniref:Peptidase S8/S53 domain-containing protein n=1 Tax=Rhizoctonia solani TaxID=456999 RepID=A0A8H3CU52_9AGAM|nr:unnamed protein product [Rhizoctonia solani]